MDDVALEEAAAAGPLPEPERAELAGEGGEAAALRRLDPILGLVLLLHRVRVRTPVQIRVRVRGAGSRRHYRSIW